MHRLHCCTCHHRFNPTLCVASFYFVRILILPPDCAYIVKEYASQLKDEEMEHEMKRAKVNAYAPQAQPVVINNMYGGRGYNSTEKMV